jgi:hypothetical protein
MSIMRILTRSVVFTLSAVVAAEETVTDLGGYLSKSPGVRGVSDKRGPSKEHTSRVGVRVHPFTPMFDYILPQSKCTNVAFHPCFHPFMNKNAVQNRLGFAGHEGIDAARGF